MSKPGTLLVVLMVSVPVIVGLAVLAGVLLVRSGVGMLVGFGVPFLVAMLIVGGLGVGLASASGRGRE